MAVLATRTIVRARQHRHSARTRGLHQLLIDFFQYKQRLNALRKTSARRWRSRRAAALSGLAAAGVNAICGAPAMRRGLCLSPTAAAHGAPGVFIFIDGDVDMVASRRKSGIGKRENRGGGGRWFLIA
jgi:hypothetical protein